MTITMNSIAAGEPGACHHDSQQPGLAQRLRKAWNSRTGSNSAALREESIMNQHVNRRTVISASAAITSGMMAGSAVAEALPNDRAGTVSAGELPVDRVTRLASELAEALNEYENGNWCAEVFPAARYEHYVALKSLRSLDFDAASTKQLARLMKLHREAFLGFEGVVYFSDSLALGRERTRRELRILDKADKAERAAFAALCGHRCMTTFEYETKLRYVYMHVNMTACLLTEGEVDAVLMSSLPLAYGSSKRPSEKGIAWVRQMQADGYVFVCRGHMSDIDNYAIRKDLAEGDDTVLLLKEMYRQERYASHRKRLV